MRIAALGGMETAQEQAQETNAQNGKELVRISLYTGLQAAFIAPGLYIVGVRGWRLLGASIAGSASFTLLSWLWAYAHNATMVPVGLPAENTAAGAQGIGAAKRRMRQRPKLEVATNPEIVDL